MAQPDDVDRQKHINSRNVCIERNEQSCEMGNIKRYLEKADWLRSSHPPVPTRRIRSCKLVSKFVRPIYSFRIEIIFSGHIIVPKDLSSICFTVHDDFLYAVVDCLDGTMRTIPCMYSIIVGPWGTIASYHYALVLTRNLPGKPLACACDCQPIETVSTIASSASYL